MTHRRMKRIGILIMLLMLATLPASASLDDIIRGSQDSAMNSFARQVMPIDGWAKVGNGDAMVVQGQAFWNPDYYVVFNSGKVKFWGPIPQNVDVSVEVYKVWFGTFASPQDEYNDVWWSKGRVGNSGWMGSFFVSGFEWNWLGTAENPISQAWLGYNSPDIFDMSIDELDFNLTSQSSQELTINVVDWDDMKKSSIGSMYILEKD